jgi:kynurenine formamidase
MGERPTASGGASSRPSYAELRARTDAPPGSAWGVFGAGDQLGTVNLLGPDQARAAAGLVRSGRTFNLDYPLDAFDPPFNPIRHIHRHEIFGRHASHRDDYLDGFYLQAGSQLDGLRHMGHPDYGFYNGADAASFTAHDPTLGIGRWADHGLVGRGVLLDVERHLAAAGRPIDQTTNQAVGVDVLESTAAAQGVSFQEGDILLLRFGWAAFFLAGDAARRAQLAKAHRVPGLAQSHDTAAWLWDHGFSVVAADNYALEAWPAAADSPFVSAADDDPMLERFGAIMHRCLIGLLGLAIGELWHLDELAADCAATGSWASMVVAKPLNLTGGVGSPANAVAIR